MKKLEQAMYEFTFGTTGTAPAEVEDVTARYLPKVEEMKAEIDATEKEIIRRTVSRETPCEVSCQVSCQAESQLHVQQQPTPKPEGRPIVVEESKVVICAECKHYYVNKDKFEGHRCVAKRHSRLNVVSGERFLTGEVSCVEFDRNMTGNCKLYEEVPDCDLKLTNMDRHLYNFRLIKVYWDGDKQSWIKKFGIRIGD